MLPENSNLRMTDFVKNQLTRKLARIKLLKREIDIDTADVKHLTFVWDNTAFGGCMTICGDCASGVR